MRFPRWSALAVATLLAAACGSESPSQNVEAPQPDTAAAPVEQAADTAAAAAPLHRFLPDEMRRATRPETFPHDAHVQIDCAVCHDVPRGHGSHEDVGCAACHRSSASATLMSLTPDQCQSCHHDPARGLTCTTCHQVPPLLASTQQLDFGVWSAPRNRQLNFDHSVHDELQCVSCHRALPSLLPAESCASCHEPHHAEGVRCMSCHLQPPPSARDVQAHLSCSGTGCHSAPEVEAIASTRQVCLVCHQAQEDHEPGGNCVECHQVRPEGLVR